LSIYVNVSSPECKENHNIKVANRSFENVVKFKTFGNNSNKSRFD
jgi:hypothetical protein